MWLTLLVSHQFLQLTASAGSQSLPPMRQQHARHQKHHCVQHRYNDATVYQLVSDQEGEVQRIRRHPHSQETLSAHTSTKKIIPYTESRRDSRGRFITSNYYTQYQRNQYQSLEHCDNETLRLDKLHERCSRLISSRSYLNYSSIKRYFSRNYWYSQDQVTACSKDCCSSRTYCCNYCNCLASINLPTLAARKSCYKLYLIYANAATQCCSQDQRWDRSFCSCSRRERTSCLAHLSCQLCVACLSCEKWLDYNYSMCRSSASLSSYCFSFSALYFSSRFSRRFTSCLLQRASSSIAFRLSRSSASVILIFPNCLASISASFLCSSNCCHSHSFLSVSPLILPVSCTFIEIEVRLSDGWH